MDDLIQKLKHLIIETLSLEEITPEEIEENTPLFGEGLGLDSVDALELVVMVEKHYSIKITKMEEGKKAFFSVGSLAQFIRDHQCEKKE